MNTLEKALIELAHKSNADPTLRPKKHEANYQPVHVTSDSRFPGYMVWSTVTKNTRMYHIIPETNGIRYKRGTETEIYKDQKSIIHRLVREIYRP